MKNKNASASLTISWFGATILVIFILFIYLFFAGTIATAKKSFSDSDYQIKFKSFHDASIEREFLSFLDSQTSFEGKTIRVVDLISDKELYGNERYFSEFLFLSNSFLKKFSISGEFLLDNNFKTYSSVYSSSFIRIYNSTEIPTEDLSLKSEYSEYTAWASYDTITSTTADGTMNVIYCSPEEDLFTEVFISNNKKIAFCMEYK
jgi:hypothetical protein